jgi:hypothetical protein
MGDRDTILEFSPVCIDSSVVHDYIGKNFNSINDSRIFPGIVKRSHDGREFYYDPRPNHPNLYFLNVYIKDTVINWSVNVDDVREDYSIRNDRLELIQFK